tara:strand:- start:9973 stop:10290 length:318 start_codon:yes stop_codon:yes gene_type:complete
MIGIFNLNRIKVEWPSGLRRTLGKRVEVQISRGFESLLHYKHHSCPEGWLFLLVEIQTRLKTQPRKIVIRLSEADEVFGVNTPGWAKLIQKKCAENIFTATVSKI